VKPHPLLLREMEKEIDCGCEAFWQRWWNAEEIDMPRIVSELSFCLDSLLKARGKDRELLKRALYEEISLYFVDAVNFGKLLMLREIKQRVKSAVQGLLEEIEKIKESLNESIKQAEKEDVSHAKYDFWFALDIVEQIEGKIKKWFPDVVEGGECQSAEE